jgi:DNA-directed RNA polymerase subunit RPC12/RpoP
MQQTVKCPNCGSPNAAGQQFCTACGAGLAGVMPPQAMTCPNCGSPTAVGQQFCTTCGTNLLGRGKQQVLGRQQVPSARPETTRVTLSRKYGVLSGAAIIFTIVGWVVLVGGSLFSIVMTVLASQDIAGMASLINIISGVARIAGISGIGGIGLAVMTFGGVICSLLLGLFFLAFGELFRAVLDIEKRTRQQV